MECRETKLCIEYPAGAGGNWLSNLIFNLENNQQPNSNILKNYHNESKSPNVILCHRIENKTVPHIKFGGTCVFNFYINFLVKTGYDVKGSFNFCKIEAVDKLKLDSIVDLDYRLLNSPELFADCLFRILDNHNFLYQKNYDVVKHSINLYKKSCPNIDNYINNQNEKLWLAWKEAVDEIKKTKSTLNFTINRSVNLKNTP